MTAEVTGVLHAAFHSNPKPSVFILFPFKDELTDLKLVIEDTIDNVATLQDCSMGHSEPLQLLSENKPVRLTSQTREDLQCVLNCLTLICEFSSGLQQGRPVQDQATLLEVKTMLSEMKELLHQQVSSSVPVTHTVKPTQRCNRSYNKDRAVCLFYGCFLNTGPC